MSDGSRSNSRTRLITHLFQTPSVRVYLGSCGSFCARPSRGVSNHSFKADGYAAA